MKESESQRAKECCMCGDTGFSDEIFQCRTCLYRFQHKYCSYLYPKTDSYQTCDWCLTSGELNGKPIKDSTRSLHRCTDEKSMIQSNRDSGRGFPGPHHQTIKKQGPGVERPRGSGDIQHYKVSSQKLIGNKRIHKQAGAGGEGRGVMTSMDFGRTQQLQIPSSKRLVRGKIRRYKLLDQVSS